MTLSRFVDILMSFPILIFALMILSVVGTSVPTLIVVIALLDSTRVFRLSRAVAMDIAVMEYVEAPQPDNDKSFYIAPSPDCRAGKTGIAGELAACKVTRDCAAGLTCIDNFCQVYNGAIFFSAVPDPDDKIEINYAADLGL